ncbi:hypothetical protein JCM3765_006509 [Sporobolomyces pararoseus]
MASPAAFSTNSSSIPAFLSPTRSELNNIWRTLSSREQARRIPRQTAGGVEDPFAVRVGTSRQNRRNNRYSDITAYDSTRILIPLHSDPSFESFHYVNASLISEPDLGFPPELLPRGHWVAAQGPTRETVPSFLSLLLDPPTSPALASAPSTGELAKSSALPFVNLVVQLTPLREGDREKCAPYFPATEGEGYVWNGIEDRLDGGEQSLSCSYQGESFDENGKPWKRPKQRRKLLRLSKLSEGSGRDVLHVEYKGWRDHGVPESPSDLLTFVKQMQNRNKELSDVAQSPAPILVHCSAGVGRTGTYITIASLLPLLSLLKRQPNWQSTLSTKGPHPLGEDYPASEMIKGAPIDFVGLTVDRIRDQRTTMVQTKEQLEFIYEALRYAWVEMDKRER